MKKFLFTIFALPAILLSGCGKSADNAGSSNVADVVFDNIMARTSVRSYTDEPVTDGQIDTLLRAAMAAPTAVNKQPWRFVVIRDRATLDSIAANMGAMRYAAQAPLAISVCGDMTAALPGDAQPYWYQDASAATENLLLAATSMGLGAVWCGVAPIQSNIEYISTLLGLPEQIVPLNVIIIGHPDGDTQPKDKWKPENVHYDRW